MGHARGGSARTTGSSGGSVGGWVGGVEPEHVGIVVIPYRHDEGHTARHGLAHGWESAMSLEGVVISKCSLLGIAERGSDRVTSDTGDCGLRVGDDPAVLDVESLDFGERVADELSDNCELGGGVDGQTLSVERLVSHTVGVEITSIRIASASVSGAGVGSTAAVAIAHSLRGRITRVRGYCRSYRVGFPDIHLSAA